LVLKEDVVFKFLHAADIHLDSPLRNLAKYPGAPEQAIRQATRKALENLTSYALAEKVHFVLIAGDVYDGQWDDYNTGHVFMDNETFDQSTIADDLVGEQMGYLKPNTTITVLKSLPFDVTLARPLASAVHFHHTEFPVASASWLGSPGSIEALVLNPDTMNGELDTSDASEKPSFSGFGSSACSAVARLRRPPVRHRRARLSRASVEEYSLLRILAIGSPGNRVFKRAIAPLTNGVAMDVPLRAR